MKSFNKYYLIYFLFFMSNLSLAKVLIMTYHFNRPDFIELQYKTFKKFLLDEYELVVFNDAKDPVLEKEIKNICDKYGITCHRIDQKIHTALEYNNPSVRAGNVVNYSLRKIGFDYNGLVVFLDGDMFLVRPFSFEKYMCDTDLAACIHCVYDKNGLDKIEYIWIGIVLINMSKVPDRHELNFSCSQVNGVQLDTGGETHYYLKNHPNLKIKKIGGLNNLSLLCQGCRSANIYDCKHNGVELEKMGFNSVEKEFLQEGPYDIEVLFDNLILHYRRGTNWNDKSPEFHSKKTMILNNFMDKILAVNYLF